MTLTFKRSQLTSSLLVVGFTEVVNKFFPLVAIYLAQQRLGLAGLGYAQYLIFLLDLIVPFVNWGYYGIGVHSFASARSQGYKRDIFYSIFCLRLVHALAGTSLLLLSVWLVPAWKTYQADVLILCFLPLLSALSCSYLFTATQSLKLQSLYLILAKVLALGSIFVLVSGEEDAFLYGALIFSVGPFVNVLGFASFVKQMGLPLVRIKTLRFLFRKSLPFTGPLLLWFFSERVDLVVVEAFFSLTDVGAFSGPQKINQSMTALGAMLTLVFQSELMRVKNQQDQQKLVSVCLLGLFALYAPLVLCVWLVGDELLPILLGGSFAGRGLLWGCVTLQLILYPIILVGTQLALFRKMAMSHVTLFWSLFIALGVLFGWLAARSSGSVHLTLVALFVGKLLATCWLFFKFQKFIRVRVYPLEMSLVVLGAVMACASLHFTQERMHLVWQVMIAVFIYVCVAGPLLLKRVWKERAGCR